MGTKTIPQLGAAASPNPSDLFETDQGAGSVRVPLSAFARLRLTGPKTFYVAATGSDANDGSSGSPWATLQHAMDVISETIDTGGNVIEVSIGSGSFAGIGVRSVVGGGSIRFIGAGSTSTTITGGLNDGTFNFGEVLSLAVPVNAITSINKVKMLQVATGQYNVAVYVAGINLVLGDPDYIVPCDIIITTSGAGGNNIVITEPSLLAVSPVSLVFSNSVSVLSAFTALSGGKVICDGSVSTTGSQNFTGAFIYLAANCSFSGGMTLSGSATGPFYRVGQNSTALLNGQTLTGISVGALLPGGQTDILYTVAQLPVAANSGDAANVGARLFVTDSNTTLAAGLGNTVVGGGSNIVPLYSDGVNWKIG